MHNKVSGWAPNSNHATLPTMGILTQPNMAYLLQIPSHIQQCNCTPTQIRQRLHLQGLLEWIKRENERI
jgi:hypothetical protein